MWSWLERLLKSLQADTQDEEDNRQQRIPSSSRQPQTRTKNIYPRERERVRTKPDKDQERRGQFRFPVIPDKADYSQRRKGAVEQDSPFEVFKQEQGKQLTSSQEPSKQPETKKDKQPVFQPDEKEGQAFKPTQIISPIYGKIDPNKKAERTTTVKTPEKEAFNKEDKQVVAEVKAQEPNVPMEITARKETAATFPIIQSEPSTEVNDPAVVEEFKPEIEVETRSETGSEIEVEPDSAEPDSYSYSESKPEPVIKPSIEPVIVEAAEVKWFEHGQDQGALPDQDQMVTSEPEQVAISDPEQVMSTDQLLENFTATADPVIYDDYEFPSLALLDQPPIMSDDSYEYTLEQKRLLEETLENFHVNAQVVGIVKGPSVTRFELQPAPGVKVNKITGLSDDIKLNLAAKDIRIEAPIPGRNAVGIEVPNLKSEPIYLRRIIGSEKFQNHPSPLAIALGMDIGGEPIVADIKKMPHGLIAGATGSGKSVCINSIIISLLYKATPEQVRLLLIDPKMVELAPYNHLPHLVTPVVTDAKQATAALKWAVEEMEKRYALFVDAGVRDIDRYNKQTDQRLPYIVIIIDELADLMMVSPQDVEDCIIRIAQKARACGIHLLLATQRPSVDVITGNIKANVPTRLAFAVFSQIDSRTILDQSGAERLLGRGDMLFLESGATPIRLQGNYVSDDEIDRVTEMIKNQRKPSYLFSKEDLEQTMNSYDLGDDSLFYEALVFVAEQGQASASALQRRFRIGYNRAARLIDMMEAEGFIAGQSGGKPRAVLITAEDAQAMAEGTTLL